MSQATQFDPFQARDTFDTGHGQAGIYRLEKLEKQGLGAIGSLPISIRVLLESVLRNCDGYQVSADDVKSLATWNAPAPAKLEIPFKPARVVLQDFTGVPSVVDLAAMRSAMQRLGGDPRKINPLIPVDLVIDHSVQVDRFGTQQALTENVVLEFERNAERYEFLRWGQKSFDNFRVVPPNVGIVHQVNLEYLAKGVFLRSDQKGPVALPDSLVGTDSHTTMINGLGVVGWGVGGIEAEAVMLGQPLYMLLPEVIGFEVTGEMPAGATATDLVLMVTETLRKLGVVDKFVEFFGPGVSKMTLADRATIANMSPEYGATMGFFPVDDETLRYLRRTGRTEQEVQLVERYNKEQGLFRRDDSPRLNYTKVVSFDLSTVEPSLAGPKRPQDRVPLASMKKAWEAALKAPIAERGFGLDCAAAVKKATVRGEGKVSEIGHGAIVIAAITSCTNTSNPSVMLAAGLLAKKAVEKGLTVPPYVKTSLAPGSRVVTDYLDKSGLAEPLRQLGFYTVGYGCTTCIGNSGPLPEAVAAAVNEGDLVAAAVLSGNRNFEGRVNPLVKANYLASPPLVVAYAIAGTTDIDLINEPLGRGKEGDVFLKDIWPTPDEVQKVVSECVLPEMFAAQYAGALDSNPMWNKIAVAEGDLYAWNPTSTYIQEPPFLADLTVETLPIEPVVGARVLALLGDSVTTDHISPAGSIAKNSPAGKYLQEHGVEPLGFNSYGSRRGNDRVMVRGTFAIIRIRIFLAPCTEGGVTRYLGEPDGSRGNGEAMAGIKMAAEGGGSIPLDASEVGKVIPIYDAAMLYRHEHVPTIILAGAEYGTGSSRDWAAKGTLLLGVRVTIATSYERIHRSNLVNMGVLPLQFMEGETWKTLGLTGEEVFDIPITDELQPRSTLTVTATSPDGTAKTFEARIRIDTPVELDYYRNGGILHTVVRKLLATAK
jgi:aconitate hydratase